MTTTNDSVKFWSNLNKNKLEKLKNVKITPLKKTVVKQPTIDYFEEEEEEYDTVSLGNLDEKEYDFTDYCNDSETND